MQIGYSLSSEEHSPRDLIANAVAAERAGFPFGLISDHFHPWVDQQGHSSFVWSVLGAIASQTTSIRLGTGVTCPIIRIHPAIVAQAAATTASLFGDRFFLGVGTGENLNEHVVGEGWPPPDARREMLAEAVDIMRELWRGRLVSHRGDYFKVEDARIYAPPTDPIEVFVAAGSIESAALAGQIGDGIIATAPDRDLLASFDGAGGDGPRYAQVTVCWADSEQAARATALHWWPNAGLRGPLSQELRLPSHFEASAEMVSEEEIAEAIACGPDPAVHVAKIAEYRDAGFDHIYLHQVGPDQSGFMQFCETTLFPELEALRVTAASSE